jgi:hypothetical protein
MFGMTCFRQVHCNYQQHILGGVEARQDYFHYVGELCRPSVWERLTLNELCYLLLHKRLRRMQSWTLVLIYVWDEEVEVEDEESNWRCYYIANRKYQ